MNYDLHFKPGYYKITKLYKPNILEVDDIWFIKLKGVSDDTKPEELDKWLKKSHVVRIIPYRRSRDARIISDVWLGNTHINRQFPNYKINNFKQAFEQWNTQSEQYNKSAITNVIEAFYTAQDLIDGKLKEAFDHWLKCHNPQQNGTELSSTETAKQKLIEAYTQWEKAGALP